MSQLKAIYEASQFLVAKELIPQTMAHAERITDIVTMFLVQVGGVEDSQINTFTSIMAYMYAKGYQDAEKIEKQLPWVVGPENESEV